MHFKDVFMTRIIRKIMPAIVAALALAATVGCTSAPSASAPANMGAPSAGGTAAPTTATVTRGDILLKVSVDGNLNMPQAFDLHFGAPGNVKDIFVEEGDLVKAGAVMATLDSASLQLDIKAANISLQQTIARLYETIPDVQMTMGYPSFYPNASAALPSGWALQEMNEASKFLAQGQSSAAAAKIRIASADLVSCSMIFQDAISNPESGLGSMSFEYAKKYVLEEGGENGKIALVLRWQEMVDAMSQAKKDLDAAAKSAAAGQMPSGGLAGLIERIRNIDMLVRDNINRVQLRRINTIYPEEELASSLLSTAEVRLGKALELIQSGGLNSVEYNENLAVADHNMQICNAMLNNSILVLENGLSLKNYQAANIDLNKAQITLANSKENLLKSVIIAPFDGMVVSVLMKKNDILSQVDYSSKGTIQLVDTATIRFQGQVDEIDTLKISKGQRATLSVDAVSDRKFTGKVSFISPYGTKVGNVIKFPITIELDPPGMDLQGGLSATAEIALASAVNVLKIPLTAITNTPQGAFVSVAGAPGAIPERRPVVIGIQDNQFAEVKSGLKEGDKIVIGEKLSGGSPVITRPVPPPPR
jgi:RND family efflux transporter MFP subunit